MALDADPFMRTGTRGSPSWPTALPEGRIRLCRLLRPADPEPLADGAGHTFARDAATSEEAGQPAQAYRKAVLLQRLLHFAQVDLRLRLVGLEDQIRMSFDPMGVPVTAHRLWGGLALRPGDGGA